MTSPIGLLICMHQIVLSGSFQITATARNCLHHSGYGNSFSRLMWNNGRALLWQHIKDILAMNESLKIAPKMRDEHVDLTSHSVMKVNLAVQTLSATNAHILKHYHDAEKHATAEYCSLMNDFFHIMNVRREHVTKRNPLLKPFSSEDDQRFEWLLTGRMYRATKWRVHQRRQEQNVHLERDNGSVENHCSFNDRVYQIPIKIRYAICAF